MKTKLILLLLSSAFVWLGCQQKPQSPLLFIPAPSIDMGDIKFDSSYLLHYELTNKGSALLVIDTATASCGCTIPKIREMRIEPGEKSMLTVEFKPADTGRFDKRVVIKSNTDSSFSVVSFRGRAVKRN